MLIDYQEFLASLVRDDNNIIAATDINRSISLAITRYSNDCPLEIISDMTPNGTKKLPAPMGWVDGFSRVVSIEYPIGEFVPKLLDSEQFRIYKEPTGVSFKFDFIPTENTRVTYTTPHIVDNVTDSINPKHVEAVVCWAAALCCEQLAAYYASASDSTIQADHVQRNSQSADYARLAKIYRDRYFSGLGIDDNKQAAACAVVNLDLTNSVGGDRFTHQNRYR